MIEETITTVLAREKMADLINKVGYENKRIVITRRKKPLAALVSMDDLKILEDIKRKQQ